MFAVCLVKLLVSILYLSNYNWSLLFTIYIVSISRHDFTGHIYADDMQIFVSFEIMDNPSPQIHRMEACIKDIRM